MILLRKEHHIKKNSAIAYQQKNSTSHYTWQTEQPFWGFFVIIHHFIPLLCGEAMRLLSD